MNEQEKQAYLKKYKLLKEKGIHFFPDALFKDAIVSLFVFIILILLAYFVGAPLEARANPADSSYTPRPEWYFLFLFQLLKYFPGNLELLGVVVLPTLVILLLFLLPIIDRNSRRYPFSRPVVIGITGFLLIGVVYLTVRARLDAPPPEQVAQGDETAALYASNCAGCHGPSITVKPGINLHEVIAQGQHEGMPAWSSDLTSDQIDALAGYILSPGGSNLFTDQCGSCHEVAELVASDPLKLRNALEQGPDFAPHADVGVPDWKEILSLEQRTTLLNFLLAPDGQRLYTINCSPCHGDSVAFSGDKSALTEIIKNGGMHLEMPPWRGKLSDSQLEILANYVTNPSSAPEGEILFSENCASCHGKLIPQAKDVNTAKQIIASGGSHQTMPVWGNILTTEQLDALVTYTLEASKGTSSELGSQLFAANCTICHGELGEGGANPVRPGDIIAPISSAEFLKTRDDFTLRSIIAQGQPNFGMSPFGSAYGGPLEDDQIDAIVAYIRSWEQNPPVEFPPEVSVTTLSLENRDIFQNLCAQCHGENGEGSIGPSLIAPDFQANNTDQAIFDTINLGHKATSMIGWGEILTAEQIEGLVKYIRQLGQNAPATPTSTAPKTPTFTADILPIFQEHCNLCHGTMGGWDGSSYHSTMTTGDHGPVIVPGDINSSLLAQKIQGTQTDGGVMPPTGLLPDDVIQIILNWIAAGAPEN